MLKLVTKEIKHEIEYMGATFEVLPMPKDQLSELIEKHQYWKKVEKSKSSKPEYVEKTHFLELMIEKLDLQVIGWKGIEGNPPCNSENKRALAVKPENNDICMYILEEIEAIGTERDKEEAKKAKN